MKYDFWTIREGVLGTPSLDYGAIIHKWSCRHIE